MVRSVLLGVLVSLCPLSIAMAASGCELPDYSTDKAAWAAVDKLELVRLPPDSEKGVDVIWGNCPLSALDPATSGSAPEWCNPRRNSDFGGTAVLLKRYKGYACVIGANGLRRTFWIKQADLTNADAIYAGKKEWAAAYRHYPSFDQLDITPLENGRYLVSGGVIVAAGEGARCGFFELSQVDRQLANLDRKTPRLRHVRVNLKVSNCNQENKETRTKGRALSGCELFLKKRGPFLFVRENGKCADDPIWVTTLPSKQVTGFQGIWTRYFDEKPVPRKNHALNMQLGR